VSDHKLRDRAHGLAETIVTWSSPDAVRALKSTVYATDKLQREMAHVYLHQVRISSPDAREGPRVFRQKRTPN
jgi:enoyl-CoA hydratase/carnithine racemase